MKDKAVVLVVVAIVLGVMETTCVLVGQGDNNMLPMAGIIGGLAGYMLKEPVDKTGSAMKAVLGF